MYINGSAPVYSIQGGIDFSIGSRWPPPAIFSAQATGVPIKLPWNFQVPAATPGRSVTVLLWIRIYKRFGPVYSSQGGIDISTGSRCPPPSIFLPQATGIPLKLPWNFQVPAAIPGRSVTVLLWIRIYKHFSPVYSSWGGIDFWAGSRCPPPAIF